MANVFSFVRGNEIRIHPKTGFNSFLRDQENTVRFWKENGLNFWDQLDSNADHESRQVLISNGNKAYVAVAIRNAARDRMVVFNVKGAVKEGIDNNFYLQSIVCLSQGQVQRYFDEYPTEIPVCKTKLSNEQLAQLALWCKKDRFQWIRSDAAVFARDMAREIALFENRMPEHQWRTIEQKILVCPRQPLRIIEIVARNNEVIGDLVAFVGDVPFYNMLAFLVLAMILIMVIIYLGL